MAEIKPEQDAWERSPGYVYFIAACDPPIAIKIGITVKKGLRKRLSAHQGSNHEPLTILKLIPFDNEERPMVSAQRMEQHLHEKFARLQRFEKGWAGSEWFTADPELLSDGTEHK